MAQGSLLRKAGVGSASAGAERAVQPCSPRVGAAHDCRLRDRHSGACIAAPDRGCPKSAPALATPLFTHQRTLTAAPATASARSPRRAGEELLASVTWRLRSRSGLRSERNGQAQQAGDRERGSRRHIDGGCVETLVEAPRATPLHGKQ